MNDCNKKHRYLERYQGLPYSQECVNNKRHKCAGCVYILGIKDALNGLGKRNELPDDLPNSQAGKVRHKDAIAAYHAGYEEGMKINS